MHIRAPGQSHCAAGRPVVVIARPIRMVMMLLLLSLC